MSAENTAEGKATTIPPQGRKAIRDALLGNKHLAARESITIFGVDIELRQPTFESILDAKDEQSEKQRVADMVIKYAYVPGTDEQLFEESDIPTILAWPFGDDLMRLNLAITKMTGIDISAAVEELTGSPLKEQ